MLTIFRGAVQFYSDLHYLLFWLRLKKLIKNHVLKSSSFEFKKYIAYLKLCSEIRYFQIFSSHRFG